MPKDTIPNFLLKKPSRQVNPYANYKIYKDKEVVLLLEKKVDFWDTHPDGVIIESEGSVFINGNDLVYKREREYDVFRPPKGLCNKKE
ncbi:MAG: hypothetical protein HYW77_03075 [Parcubacteria group bacterium]|nr:hypothetical protein [Parcubacteria group bacterium]